MTKNGNVAREEELKRSVERLQALIDEAPIAVMNVDTKGKITYVNKDVLQRTGYLREELVGKNGFRLGLFPRETLKLLGRRMKEKLMGKPPSPLEMQFKRKDGEWMWVETRGKAFWEHGMPMGIQIMAQDITERKRMEHDLNERVKELTCLYGIARIDERPEITPDELYQEIANLLPASWQYPEITCARIIIDDKVFCTRNYTDTEWKQSSDIKVYGAKAGIVEVNHLEERAELDEGAFLKEERLLIDAVAKQLGNITERKRMEEEIQGKNEQLETQNEELQAANEEVQAANEELQEAQEKLVRSERLAAIGQLAGGVGHELRNPLGAIKNAVYYVQRRLAKTDLITTEPRVMEFLDIMDGEVNAVNKVITDLLGFSRVVKPTVSSVRIARIIEDALSYAPLPEDIDLAKDIDEDLPMVMVDADQIRQVFINMITNAVQAMPEGGKLTIGARKKGGFLEVEVADTGCGIPEESVDKIFDPLFTTKAKGIGLGLAVCKSILERHGGDIQVESEEGRGTTFTVCLPIKRS